MHCYNLPHTLHICTHICTYPFFSCATRKYCGQLHLQLQVTTSQGLALPHQKHIRYHGRNCFNARTRSPASKKPGSMSQRWPGTTGAEHSHRNFSFKNRLIASQLLQHFFWKPSVKELRVQSPSPSQFSQIKNVIHVQEKMSYLYWARKHQWLNVCTCFSAKIEGKETDPLFTWQRVWGQQSRINAPDQQEWPCALN